MLLTNDCSSCVEQLSMLLLALALPSPLPAPSLHLLPPPQATHPSRVHPPLPNQIFSSANSCFRASLPRVRCQIVHNPEEAAETAYTPYQRHLLCMYSSLFLLILVQAIATQTLPYALQEIIGSHEKVADRVASIAACSALLEFALLPITAAISDTFGRRPILLMIPLVVSLARFGVIWRPTLLAIILSRIAVGMLTSYYFIFVGVASADLFKDNDRAMASLEGKSAACFGAAYACGMLMGGTILSSYGIGAAHAMSGLVALAGLVLALFTVETLPPAERTSFVVRHSHPLAFLRLFRSMFISRKPPIRQATKQTLRQTTRQTQAKGWLDTSPIWDAADTSQGASPLEGRASNTDVVEVPGVVSSDPDATERARKIIPRLACILALQTLHDGEGDLWQIYSTTTRGWSTRINSFYGAGVGLASMAGGLLTGSSVRRFGNRIHTIVWTSSTTLSLVMFMSSSTSVAFASIPFTAAEDCMSAAVTARLCRAGAAAGISQGQLAGDCHNLAACVRVIGLYLFGKLYSIGMRIGIPQLAYICCAAAQLAAVAGVVALPSCAWRDPSPDRKSSDESLSSPDTFPSFQ